MCEEFIGSQNKRFLITESSSGLQEERGIHNLVPAVRAVPPPRANNIRETSPIRLRAVSLLPLIFNGLERALLLAAGYMVTLSEVGIGGDGASEVDDEGSAIERIERLVHSTSRRKKEAEAVEKTVKALVHRDAELKLPKEALKRAEEAKELGNAKFRVGDFAAARRHYEACLGELPPVRRCRLTSA